MHNEPHPLAGKTVILKTKRQPMTEDQYTLNVKPEHAYSIGLVDGHWNQDRTLEELRLALGLSLSEWEWTNLGDDCYAAWQQGRDDANSQ